MNFILFLDLRLGPTLGTLYRAKLPSSVQLAYAGQLLVSAAQSSKLYFSDRFCPSDPLQV